MIGGTVLVGGKSIDVESLTCEDLRVHYFTGRNVYISGAGRNRITRYRTGIQTNIGDIEISVWLDLMRKLVIRLGESGLQKQLQQWVKENCAWLHTPDAVEQEALELHASRIFDNPEWGGYIDFNRQYRPEVLETADLIWVKHKCCGKTRQMTREQFERQKSLNNGEVFCHDCGDYTSLDITDLPKEGDDPNG